MKPGCVIMASGLSSRFGAEKLLYPFRGRPLITWAVECALSAGARTVVVTRSCHVARIACEAGAQAFVHNQPDRCDTIRYGLTQMDGLPGCAFLVADQPLLKADTLSGMLKQFCRAPERILRASHDGRPGNPVIFPSALFDALSGLKSGQTGRAVLKGNSALVDFYEVADPLELADIDTPEAMKALETYR